jgi:hypothetical protein
MIFEIDCALTSFDTLRGGHEQLSDQEAEYCRKSLCPICAKGREQMLQARECVCKRNKRRNSGKPDRTEEEEYAGWVDRVADDLDSDTLCKSADDSDDIRYRQGFLFSDLIAFMDEICLVQ